MAGWLCKSCKIHGPVVYRLRSSPLRQTMEMNCSALSLAAPKVDKTWIINDRHQKRKIDSMTAILSLWHTHRILSVVSVSILHASYVSPKVRQSTFDTPDPPYHISPSIIGLLPGYSPVQGLWDGIQYNTKSPGSDEKYWIWTEIPGPSPGNFNHISATEEPPSVACGIFISPYCRASMHA